MTDQSTPQDKAEDAEVQHETIDDLFEDKSETEDKAEVTEKAKGEEPEKSEEEEEAKAEAKTEEPEKKEAEPPAAKEESVPLKALTEERRKRQDAENRARELDEKLKQANPEGTKVPDPATDSEGYAQYVEDKNNLAFLQMRASLSRELMMESKTDYAEKEQVFIELVRGNPEKGIQPNPFLAQQMNASPNPARFAYQTAVDHLEFQTYRDPKYREKLEAEIREKVEKELQEKQPDKTGKKSALEVPDLTKATAAGKNSDKAEKLTELDDIDTPIDKA